MWQGKAGKSYASKWRQGHCLTWQFCQRSPHMSSRRSQRERATPEGIFASCFIGTTLIGSLVIMGLSASIVAHDHNLDSSIGITHLVVGSGMPLQLWAIYIQLTNENLISLWSVCSSYSVHVSLYALPSPDKIEQTWHKDVRSQLSSSRWACTLDRSSLCLSCLLRERIT